MRRLGTVFLSSLLLAGCAQIGGRWDRTHYEIFPSPGRITTQSPEFLQLGPLFFFVSGSPLNGGLVLGPLFAGLQLFGFSMESEIGSITGDAMSGLQTKSSDVWPPTLSAFTGNRQRLGLRSPPARIREGAGAPRHLRPSPKDLISTAHRRGSRPRRPW